MQIAKDKVVSIDYTLTNPDGQVLDSSEGKRPLDYLHGSGGIIPGLEAALEGRENGASIQVVVPPAEAYGEKDDSLVQQLSRDMFQGVDDIKPGMQFQAQGQDGQARIVTVTEVADDGVTIDANHPLAGVTLSFDVTVRDVRDATAEEIEHGHAHGPGGHQHG